MSALSKRLRTLFILASVSLLAPFPVAHAIAFIPIPSGAYVDSAGLVSNFFNYFWPIVVAFSIVMFVVAAFNFFTAQGNTEKIATATRFFVFGIVGMAVALIAFSVPLIVKNVIGV